MTTAAWQIDPAHSVRVPAHAGTFDAYVGRPAAPSRAVLVVLHEVFGVNADIRATCDELAQEGYLSVAPDLFWRQERGVDLSVRSQADWEKGVSLYKKFE